MNVDDGLEDIRWIRGGERLPAACYALVPNLIFFFLMKSRAHRERYRNSTPGIIKVIFWVGSTNRIRVRYFVSVFPS